MNINLATRNVLSFDFDFLLNEFRICGNNYLANFILRDCPKSRNIILKSIQNNSPKWSWKVL